MPNTSFDGFSVLSPSQKKELERQRQEEEARKAAQKAEEERKSREASRRAKEAAERKAAAAKNAREKKAAKKRNSIIISLLICITLTALLVGVFYVLHINDLDVLNLLYVPLAIILGLPIIWGGIYDDLKDKF